MEMRLWSQIQLDPLKLFVPGCYLDSSRATCEDGFAHTVGEVVLYEQGPGLTPLLLQQQDLKILITLGGWREKGKRGNERQE